MISRHRKFRRRGQAAVEFALVLPFLLVLLIGIIEFGRAWNEHMVITDAAREAARQGALFDTGYTETDIRNFALNAMSAAGINPARCTGSCGGSCICITDGTSNEPILVTIDLPYQFTFFGPLVAWTTGQSNITLRTSFRMRNE